MPLFTTLVLHKTVSDSVVNPSGRPPGFRVDLAVTEHVNITDKIFVMQRELETSGGTDYVNTFYSVATPADLEQLPTAPTNGEPFYLTNSISLIFRTLEEQQRYTADIEVLVQLLAKDNDRVINDGTDTKLGFPKGATLLRYWGLSQNTTVTDEEIRGMFQDEQFDKTLRVSFTDDEPNYIFFAYRAELGAPATFKVNGVDETPVLLTRAVVSDRGYSANYRIYRTTNTFTGQNLILTVT